MEGYTIRKGIIENQWKEERELATLYEGEATAKKLSLVSWHNAPAKLDLRTWRRNAAGWMEPGKGVTLTDREAQLLAAALTAYFESKDTESD